MPVTKNDIIAAIFEESRIAGFRTLKPYIYNLCNEYYTKGYMPKTEFVAEDIFTLFKFSAAEYGNWRIKLIRHVEYGLQNWRIYINEVIENKGQYTMTF